MSSRLERNPWLKHGAQGFLMQRLVRYARLGWLLFFAAAAAFILLAVVAEVKKPIVVVADRAGRILGRIEWQGHGVRSRKDMLIAAMRFARDYLSANSDTIVHDYKTALNMMAPRLLRATVRALSKTEYLARVRAGHTRSWLVFARGAKRPTLTAWSGHEAHVHVTGTLFVILPDGRQLADPFNLLLTLTSAPRTVDNGSGVRVTAIRFIA